MNNIALITGASSGIGLELARIHASKKGDLILVARSTTRLESLKAELQENFEVEVITIPKDLSIPGASEEIYEEVNESGLKVDCLINNAGFGDYGYFHETDLEKTEMMINVNMLTLTLLTRLFGGDMVTRRSGRIMNLSSTAAFQPGPLMSVYYATKHYVQAFSEGLHEEWKDFGVTVTALCPGPTESGFQAVADNQDSKLVKGKKLPTAAEVAEFGYDAMLKGKISAVHGTLNAFMAGSVKFVPKKILLNAVRKMQEKKDAPY